MKPITPTSTRDLPIQIDKFSLDEVVKVTDTTQLGEPRLWATLSPKFTVTQVGELVACNYVAGVRFNLTKYGDFSLFAEQFAEVRRQRHNKYIEICLDTNGPKVRTRLIRGEFVDIFAGDTVVILPPRRFGLENTFVRQGYKVLPIDAPLPAVSRNDIVFLSDGWLQLVSLQDTPRGNALICQSLNDSRMYDARGVDVPGMYDKQEVLTDTDKAWLERAAKVGVDPDYVALSFAGRASHLNVAEQFLRSIGMTCRLLAKIETAAALWNDCELAETSDGLVLARGDLALDMARKGIDMLAAEQRVFETCRKTDKRCVVATRIADSLEEGRTELDVFELHRLRMEIINGSVMTLVLCNETSGAKNAIRNLRIVKTTMGKILQELSSQLGRQSSVA